MIITERRHLKKILKNIDKFEKVLIVGCRGCSAVCSTGGEREVELLAISLRLARKKEKRSLITKEYTFLRQCDPEYIKILPELARDFEAIISLACGVGINLISDLYPNLRVYPGVETLFYGANVALGIWEEKCRGCGDCIVDLTAGLCPIARCPKGLLNGPCGGSQEGKCEVNLNVPCIWHEIIERLKMRGELDKLDEIFPPKDWRSAFGEGVRKKIRKDLIL